MGTLTSVQQTPPSGGRWICLRSEAISKLVCMELANDPSEDLGPELRAALTRLSQDEQRAPLSVWVPLDGAVWLSQHLEEQERQDAAMRILIMRRANYALLWRLFRITRQRWLDVRAELNAPPLHASRVAEPAAADIDLVYNTWYRLMKECPDEIDRWVLLVQQVRHLPVPALYKLIYEEEAQS